MITEAESKAYFDQIRGLLLNSKLSWIVQQVDSEIANGKLAIKSPKEISFKQAGMFDAVVEQQLKATSKENVSTSEAYTNKEQLKILIAAMEEISDIYSLKNEAISYLQSINENIKTIRFVSPNDNTAAEISANDDTKESIEAESFRELKKIAQSIKKEI